MGHNFSQGRVILTIVPIYIYVLIQQDIMVKTPCRPGGVLGIALDLNSCFAQINLNNSPIVQFYCNNVVRGLGQRGVFLPGSSERSSSPYS